MLRFALAIFVIWLVAIGIPTKPVRATMGGERRTTLYPGKCPNGQPWYLLESDDYSVTVGCNDPDYEEPSQ